MTVAGTSASDDAEVTRIARWLVIYLAVLIGRDSDEVNVDVPFSDFDLDSVDAVEMAAEFERAFECEVGPEVFLRSSGTIREMAVSLAETTGATA